MSFTINDVIERVKKVIEDDAVVEKTAVSVGNSVVSNIHRFYTWKFFKKTNPLTLVAGQTEVQLPSPTFDDLASINSIISDDNKYRIRYLEEESLKQFLVENNSISSIPSYYNDKINSGYLNFDVNVSQGMTVNINYKRLPVFVNANTDNIDLPDKMIEIFETGLISGLLPITNGSNLMISRYMQMFRGELIELRKEERTEQDVYKNLTIAGWAKTMNNYKLNLRRGLR